MRMLGAILSGLIFVIGLAAVVSSTEARAEEKAKVEVGKPAPDVDLPATMNDKNLRLKDYQGKKIVVLYFFPKALTGG